MRRFLLPFLAIFLLLGSWGCTTSPSVEAGSDPAATSVLGPEFGFWDEDELREHYSKHGREFGSITRDEYLSRARSLRDAPVGGDILQIIRADTVRTRFDRSKGDFIAFDQDLTIRTFFRPNDGERYFNRQATRPH